MRSAQHAGGREVLDHESAGQQVPQYHLDLSSVHSQLNLQKEALIAALDDKSSCFFSCSSLGLGSSSHVSIRFCAA